MLSDLTINTKKISQGYISVYDNSMCICYNAMLERIGINFSLATQHLAIHQN